jgi:hypothetical protein
MKEELGFLIINFMLVMLGALVTGTANGSWELVAIGFTMMIGGNLGLWGMVREQNRAAVK